ncbi:hypothetical protein DAMA08_025080 [Martiniozyma asiatica (nom. inval.)]|nr:hypothetical protein DAMA08_025080 [Martiniozyma asiatica]
MFAKLRSRTIIPRLNRSLFIQTQSTPNDHALKFVPSGAGPLLPADVPGIEVDSVKDALVKSDLAFKLLSINDKKISSVLIGSDFITVEKSPNLDWAILKPQVFTTLTEHLSMGMPVLKEEFLNSLKNKDKIKEDEEMTEEEELLMLINELIQTRIRPAILEDGGDVIFLKFEDGLVYLKLVGACKSCGSSEITLKNGIEDMLKYYIDEVKGVVGVKDEDPEIEIETTKPVKKFDKIVVDELPPSL